MEKKKKEKMVHIASPQPGSECAHELKTSDQLLQ